MSLNYSHLVQLLFLSLTISNLSAAERKWTNTAGKVIHAEFISSDKSHVILLLQGKEVSYALDKLSEEDREFVAQQAATSSSTEKNKANTGWLDHVEISRPAFEDDQEYLTTSNAKTIYKAFKNKEFPDTWTEDKGDIKEMFSYEKSAMIVYVPPTYNPSKPMGIYLHISPGDSGEALKDYIPVMDRFAMIYVSPKGTSNDHPTLRRIKISIDALAEVKRTWKIDEKRVVVGGLSGGGHMAMATHAMFPQFFSASISHAAQSYYPRIGNSGHFPNLSPNDLSSKDFKDHRWVVVSGNKDYNYQEILKTSKTWAESRADYRFIDVDGMGHTNASPDKLSEALDWVLNPKKK